MEKNEIIGQLKELIERQTEKKIKSPKFLTQELVIFCNDNTS